MISDSHSLYVRSVGEGDPTLLLLHGWAVSGAVWDQLIRHWPATGGRLLVPDLRGSGRSARPERGYSLDDYTQDIVKFIDAFMQAEHEKPPTLVLVGHAMGGTIAMRVALERPHAVSKLVLISPLPANGVPLEEPDVAYFRSLGGRLEGAAQLLRMMMAHEPEPTVFSQLVNDSANVSLAAYHGAFDAWRTAGFAHRLNAITTPTVVMGGEVEQPLSPALLRAQVVSRIPGATFVPVPGVGHYPHVETPVEFASLLHHVSRC
jgi:non-heme chloroperoxidase